jgi:hypothetical protein
MPIEIKKFALAGNATFTVTSRRTGVMRGPDNETNYTFLGTIFNGTDYRHGRRSMIAPDAPSAVAFAWIWAHINDDLSQAVDIHHAGKCCRCGRKLTVPSSIESGIGPECERQMTEGM